MKKRHIATTIALMLLTAAVTYCITFYVSERQYNDKLMGLGRREQEYSKIAEVRSYIDKYYVNDYNDQDLIDGALYGMVAFLGDKWSHYLTADQFAELANSTNNKLVGIGINAAFDEESNAVLVLDVYEDAPAEAAGIKPFDIITKVDGEAVSDIGYDAAVKKITGASGTPVRLTLVRSGTPDPFDLSITRKEIDIQAVNSKILDGNIGYIRISNFDANVDKDMAEALENLKKANVSGIVFDVRNNPGGLLNVLVNVLDPIVPEGVIISEQDKFGDVHSYKSDANELNLPMAVITNRYSVSAAEFFAASLQETGKATVVGEATTGKGSAQSTIKLQDGSGLVLSVSKYFTARGVSLEESGGVKPDREVILTEEETKNFYRLTEDTDRQLQAAISAVKEKI